MAVPIRAVYEGGHLRLLDPVQLAEGEQVSIAILPGQDPALAAISDIIVAAPKPANIDLDREALTRLIERELRASGYPSISDAIIEERREGP
jgi:predicted DNA-binding antitoxin AbrB/MazE fold protein